MSTTPSAPRPLTPNCIRLRIKQVVERLQPFMSESANERLRSLWTEWKARIRDIFEATKTAPEVPISLVGGSGAGKSTLLNALIGVRVLPVGNMRACTAAICEVSFAQGPYQARIEFVPRSAWQKEVDELLGDYRATQAPTDDGDTSDERHQMSRAVRDKLWTVYRPAEEASDVSFDPFHLEEPPEITKALDAGFEEIVCEDVKEFRKTVACYLEGRHRFWPIVKSVQVRGPFEPLRDGAKIIDLPGLNDPNEAREAVTKAHLKSCRYVWVVFAIKRALQRDVLEVMQSEDFLRQIVMDGRAESLTLIATATDSIDAEAAIEEFGLDEDTPHLEVVTTRNRELRKFVDGQLEDLAARLASLVREQKESASRLAKRLKQSQIFTVSAQEYLRLQGLMKTNPGGFTHVEQTEIPALLEHMRNICQEYGSGAHCATLGRRLENVVAEVERELHTQKAILKNQSDVNERSRKEMRAAADAARDFLEQGLADARGRLVQSLEEGQAVLGERVKRATERALRDQEKTIERWKGINHLTIRAVCSRGGRHNGKTENDFSADLAKPILDGIAFAWSDFFGERLKDMLAKRTDHLVRQADGYRDRLTKSLSAVQDLPPDWGAGQDGIFHTTEKILREILVQTQKNMEGKILHEQRHLYDKVPQQVRANMQAAFERAARETGAGMKVRMIDILAKHARQVSRVMFDDASAALLDGVRGLNDWLAREYDTMIDSVRRNAALAAENLVASGEGVTGGALAAEQAMLTQLTELLSVVQQELGQS